MDPELLKVCCCCGLERVINPRIDRERGVLDAKLEVVAGIVGGAGVAIVGDDGQFAIGDGRRSGVLIEPRRRALEKTGKAVLISRAIDIEGQGQRRVFSDQNTVLGIISVSVIDIVDQVTIDIRVDRVGDLVAVKVTV